MSTLTRHLESAVRRDLNWGISTTRQRILARLEAFITTAQEFNQLPDLRGTASRLLDLLQQRWRGTPSLSNYPAFEWLSWKRKIHATPKWQILLSITWRLSLCAGLGFINGTTRLIACADNGQS